MVEFKLHTVYIILQCAIPKNIHPPPTEEIGISLKDYLP